MTQGVAAALLAVMGAYGVYLLYTAMVFGWRGIGMSPRVGRRKQRPSVEDLLVQAGLERIGRVEFLGVELVLFAVAFAFGLALYGAWLPGIALGVAAASAPILSARNRRVFRRELARENWPRMIEEIRLQVVSLGRSIPQALLSVGLKGPEEMRPAFLAAQREWLISTDLDRTLEVLKLQLADPTADAVCETLLIAHEVGGTDVDQRLRALIDDRSDDLQGRKDARAKQAGARFSRYFVLVVPFGMAIVGVGIGEGRAAFATASGQLAVLFAFSIIAGCWLWAGRLLRLPEEERVFRPRGSVAS